MRLLILSLLLLAGSATGSKGFDGASKGFRGLQGMENGPAGGGKATPAAILLGNPPGPWNNNGAGLNLACIPLVSSIVGSLLAPSLTDEGFVFAILGNVAGSLFPLPLETTVILNILSTNQIALWNALAPYTPSMQPFAIPGVPKVPANQITTVNKNTALLYASFGFVKSVVPEAIWRPVWSGLFTAVGLDINNNSTDLTTAIGIGNSVGMAVVAQYQASNWNTLGTTGYSVYQRPYADWTGFVPINTAYQLSSPLNWQPLLETTGLGYFQVQSHITPQTARVEPLLADKNYITRTQAAAPYPNGYDQKSYKDQADYVLALSAGLTDAQKMSAEYYDDKAVSFGTITIVTSIKKTWSLDQFLLAEMNIPCFVDGAIMIWREKLRYNAVRPISAIREIYRNSDVTAWVQFRGTQTFPGREWTSYLRTMPHADYPSFTACVCSIYGTFFRNMTGTNSFPNIGPITFPKGCSKREPNMTPAADTNVTYSTWDNFIDECAQTRAYAGVHFQRAINEAKRLCAPIGSQCYARAYRLRYGSNSTPGPV